MSDDINSHIIELQTKIQFQEDAIQQLDSAIIEQNKTIERLSRQIELLESKVNELMLERKTTLADSQERPPHY